MQNQSNDKLEPTKDVLEICNRYLQNKYIPGFSVTADE
jgi:hypothetical protein